MKISLKSSHDIVTKLKHLKIFFLLFLKHFIQMIFLNRRIILLNTPNHKNLGDHGIALAELEFLNNNFPNDHIIEFTGDECGFFLNWIQRFIRKDDLILVHGGGYIGTLWMREETLFLNILQRFREHKIVVFPQTVYFSQDDCGKIEKDRCKRAMEDCRKLTLCLREKRSFDVMKEILGSKNQIKLVPDIVTYLQPGDMGISRCGILFCLREDIEQKLESDYFHNCQMELIKQGFSVWETDTMAEKRFSLRKRAEAVERKWATFAAAEIVITDRLHGMLFAAVTGTPCIAVDNITRKVSGVSEWIRYLPYITCMRPEDIDLNMIQKYRSIKQCNYSNKELQQYYTELKNVIEK